MTVPGVAAIDSRSLTGAAGDPVHSCTGSADWWSLTPTNSGTPNVVVGGRRYDTAGNSGIVMTAYPAGQLGTELACATVPRDTNKEIDANTTFPVTAGTHYLIEVSATGSTAADGGYTTVIVSMAGAAISVSVTPATATITAGSAARTFSAQVTNAPNPAVRWSLSPPVGTVSPAGVYAPPVAVDQPVTVTLTATSFADSTKAATAIVTLTPISVGTAPSIAEVANATGEFPVIAQNTFVQIKGLNLGVNTRPWQGTDFVNGQLPTQLDGVGVAVNGRNAYVSYISPGQVNIITPLDSSVGTAQVQVTTNGGASQTIPVQMQPVAPGFFTFDGIHLAATHSNGSFLGPATLYPGLTTPATPGEIIVLYGNGFGQTNPPLAADSMAPSGTLPVNSVIRIGGVQAVVQYAGIGAPGEYQFNVVVPAGALNGDNSLTATYNNAVTQPGIMIAVQR